MNKLFLRIAFMAAFATALSQAQAQTFINYQASLQKPGTNTPLEPIPDGNVIAVVTIFKNGIFSDNPIYQETHKSVAVKKGLVNFQIGTGTRSFTSDFYTNIIWNINTPYYVKIDYFSGPTAIITGSMQPLSSVPYSNNAATALKADTAKVALKIAGLENDLNGKFVGSVQVFGMNEGAAIISGSNWQRVTRTCYDHIGNLFGDNGNMNNKINLPTAGTRREYYLVIRKGDNVNICAGVENLGRGAMGSEWRFYLGWKNKAGHKFQLGRNWGGNDDGTVDWVKIPPMSSYPDFSHPMYWHLEARINPNCPASNMKVHSIHVVAFDKVITSPNDTIAVNIDTDNKLGQESTYELGIKGGLQINPSRYATILGSDLALGTEDGRNRGTKPNQRALVHGDIDDRLLVNYNGDYEGGVEIQSALSIRKEKEFKIDVGTKLTGITNTDGVVYYEVVGQEYHVFGGNILSDDKFTHGLGTSDYPFSHAYIRGLTRTGVLEITGGGDIIEKAKNTEGVQAGEVVVIDPTQANQVKRSQKAYDKTVIGVVSGAGGIKHGMQLAQEGLLDGNTNFAIAGRVYVKVTGKVKIGDLLTTSEKAGYAMAVKSMKKAFGATIGKALSEPNAEGLVLMLVMMR
jgi:hypothetical protein